MNQVFVNMGLLLLKLTEQEFVPHQLYPSKVIIVPYLVGIQKMELFVLGAQVILNINWYLSVLYKTMKNLSMVVPYKKFLGLFLINSQIL
jgi:hypothetical protein